VQSNDIEAVPDKECSVQTSIIYSIQNGTSYT